MMPVARAPRKTWIDVHDTAATDIGVSVYLPGTATIELCMEWSAPTAERLPVIDRAAQYREWRRMWKRGKP